MQSPVIKPDWQCRGKLVPPVEFAEIAASAGE